MSFTKMLKENGWLEKQPNVYYVKGNWQIVFDTNSWIEIGTTKTPRVFDVPTPTIGLEQWTLNLIEHLCKADDQIHQIKSVET